MNIKKNYIVFFFFAYLLSGFFISVSTGLSHDESSEQYNWIINLEAIKSLINLGDYSLLQNYTDRYHGIAFHYISQPIQLLTKEIVTKISGANVPGSLYLAKHFVILLFFTLSGISFYYICKELSSSKKFSNLATLIYLVYPYLYGHALINPKDMPFLSFWMFSTHFFFKISKKIFYNQNILIKEILISAFFTSFLISIRTAGFLIFFEYLICFLLIINFKKIKFYNFINNNIRNIFAFFSFFLFFLYILNPVFWKNPLEVINSLDHFSKFYNDVCTLTLGECMKSRSLPTKYFFIWFFFKLPIISLLGLFLYIFVEKKIINNNYNCIIYLTLANSVILILLIFILKKIAVYDEIRHMLFLIPLILIPTFYNLFLLKDKIYFFFSILTIVFYISENFKIYPYQYSWLNPFAQFYDIQKNFEIDYWGVSNKSLQKKIIKFVVQEKVNNKICIYGDGYSDIFLSKYGFTCFKTYGELDAVNQRPFIAYQNLRNLKRADPRDCKFIEDEYYNYTFFDQKVITGKIWYCY